jgi:hypothetical protein
MMGTEGYASIARLATATERIRIEINKASRAKRNPNACSPVA